MKSIRPGHLPRDSRFRASESAFFPMDLNHLFTSFIEAPVLIRRDVTEALRKYLEENFGPLAQAGCWAEHFFNGLQQLIRRERFLEPRRHAEPVVVGPGQEP